MDQLGFGDQAKLLDIINPTKVVVDNVGFWLHRSVTVAILITVTVVLTVNTYVGDPIHCQKNAKQTQFSDTFCWIYGTKTYSDGESCGVKEVEGETTETHHEYYQWVAIVLVVQAVTFYMPGWLWAHWERGRVAEVVGENGLKEVDIFLVETEDKCNEEARKVADTLKDLKGSHKKYAARFLFCELANFANALLQFKLTDTFLGGEFSEYGTDVLEYVFREEKEGCHPMDKVFPIRTVCHQSNYGTALGTQTFQYLCVLPSNIFSQKFYLFFYFWLTFLIILGFFQTIYRVLTIFSRAFRNLFEVWGGRSGSWWTDYSDWLFNKFVLKNCNSVLREAVRKNVETEVKKENIVREEKGKEAKQPLIKK